MPVLASPAQKRKGKSADAKRTIRNLHLSHVLSIRPKSNFLGYEESPRMAYEDLI